MRILKIVIIAIVLSPTLLLAGEFETKKETRDFADKFTSQLLREEFKAAFDAAKQYWPVPAIEIDGMVNQIYQQWPTVQRRFGKAVGMEFIGEEKIGSSFHQYFYLHKFENHAIYWRISFYRPHKNWKINYVVFLDDLDQLYK